MCGNLKGRNAETKFLGLTSESRKHTGYKISTQKQETQCRNWSLKNNTIHSHSKVNKILSKPYIGPTQSISWKLQNTETEIKEDE